MHDSVTYDEFNQAVGMFLSEVDLLNERELDAAWSALGKMYLGVELGGPNLLMAASRLQFAGRRKFEREMVLQFGHNPLQRLKELVA